MEDIKKIGRYYSKMLQAGKYEPDLFELLRRIEYACGKDSIGKSSNYTEEMVRFGQEPYLHFPKTAISEISDKEKLNIFVYFFGLNGVNGPMPLEFTSFIFQRSHNHYDFTLRRFHDIINHRFIGLFYRAWKANEQAADSDFEESNLILKMINSLGGCANQNSTLPKNTGAYWSSIYSCKVRSRDGLEEILRGYFKLPIKVKDHVISQGTIPDEYRGQLGKKGNVELGRTLQLGSHYYSNTKKFVIEVGPVNFEDCQFMVPTSRGQNDLTTLVNGYLDKPFEYDVKFKLWSESIPNPKLNGQMQLGGNIWLAGRTKGKFTSLVLGASRIAENNHKRDNK